MPTLIGKSLAWRNEEFVVCIRDGFSVAMEGEGERGWVWYDIGHGFWGWGVI